MSASVQSGTTESIEPVGLDTPLDAVVFAPNSDIAIEATETTKDALETLAADAVSRAGIRFDTLIVHADRCIVQANTVVIPVTTHDKLLTTKDVKDTNIPRHKPLLLGTRHLIVKHVDLNATSVPFRDDDHRLRVQKSFACECAMYRERSCAPNANGGDSGTWATPFVYLVEGDATADTFTVVMDDVGRPRPGSIQKQQEKEGIAEAKNMENDDLTTITTRGGAEKDVAVVSVGEVPEATTSSKVNRTASVMIHETNETLNTESTNATADVDAKNRTTPRLPGACGFPRAVAAVRWLASFHAHWWRGLPDSPDIPKDLWARGGYWTLEKREGDVGDAMDTTWRGLLASFENDPDPKYEKESKEFALKLREMCGEDFGERLRTGASAVSRTTQRFEWGTPHNENGGATLVHGDFKAANIVFRRAAKQKAGSKLGENFFEDDDEQGDETVCSSHSPSPTVIDWQWTGPGACAHDLAFFLTTSVSEFSLDKTDELIEVYYERLANDLKARGDAGRSAATEYSISRLRRDMNITYADYGRYLVGDVWKGVTPDSMRVNYNKTNYGAHRRSIPHLLFCAKKGADGLAECLGGETDDNPAFDPDAPPPRADADIPPLRRGPVSKLVAEVLGVCVALADDAGDIIRQVAESGHMGTVKDKSTDDAGGAKVDKSSDKKRQKSTGKAGTGTDNSTNKPPIALDPQTQADRRAERLICETLRKRFGNLVSVFGEEQLEGALGGKGGMNADGTVDADDGALEMTEDDLKKASEYVKDWELLVPRELEMGPRRAKELREKVAKETADAEKDASKESKRPSITPEKYLTHASCVESDVTIWVDPLDGTREFVEGPEFWSGVTVLIGIAVKGVPVAGVIHQPFVGLDGNTPQEMLDILVERAAAKAALEAEGWKPKRKTADPEDDLETFPKGSFGKGRTLWGGLGVGVFSHAGREMFKSFPVPKPKAADPKNLIVTTTRSHPSPFVEGAVYNLHPSLVIRTGGAGGKVALMLDGKADVWVFPAKGTKRWDTCAGEALLAANRGGWIVRATDGSGYEYGSEISTWPGNVDGLIAAVDKDLYPWMVKKWPWLNEAGGDRKGPRDDGVEKD